MSVPHEETAGEVAEHITLRMPASLVAELRLVAKENDRSLSAEARLALRAWLARQEQAA